MQYLLEVGDIGLAALHSAGGREQAGRCPAVPISAAVASVVLSDQIKSVDWRVRRAIRKGKVSAEELAEVRAKIHALIG